ncbi:MAG TPA: ABC transporter ATP-binding protein [Burkholderiaceae bacterium]|nr:ABC transporter ATP-binding protein [Burkholderiaceae bacterium]
MTALLSAQSLNAWYGRAHILFDVALDVGPGEVVGLMGRNGAGKSTTLKAIMGLVAQRTGSVQFDGRSIEALEPFEISRAGIGFVPEDRRIFTDLTVLENLEIGRRPAHPGAPTWTVERLFDLFPNLREMPHRLGDRMSGGEQQMLTVARTLMGNPRLVLLDEPSEGVAPLIVEQMAAMIIELKRHGLSVLLSEQNVPFAAAVCDRVYVLEKGQVRFAGTMAELHADEVVRRQYLTV